MDIEKLRTWIGRSETAREVATSPPARRLAAILDRPDVPLQDGDPLPPLWHWVYFQPEAPQSRLDRDGHPQRGDFLPPVPLPRRMRAGGNVRVHRPLRIGDEMVRASEIADVSFKQGRTGPLGFVKLRRTIAVSDRPAIEEEQMLVYREARAIDAPSSGAMQRAPEEAPWRRRIDPDPVLLFRYTAVVFNAHRIHYDRDYATSVEGYPGLVVPGPLVATLLLDLLHRQRPQAAVTAFEFRGISPLFDTDWFTLAGTPIEDGQAVSLWAAKPDGTLASTATARISAPAQAPGERDSHPTSTR